MTVYAFDPKRTTNAALMVDCRTLGYLSDDELILDPTWGEGRFWRLWQPKGLHVSDLHTVHPAIDFTDMPWEDEKFDAVVFDPPYKLNGTGGSHPSDEGYGVDDRWSAVAWRMGAIYKGMGECLRVLKPGGIFLLKCQDQVCSGNVVWQVKDFTDATVGYPEEPDAKLIDMLFVCGGIPQPKGRRQVHARRNYSTCLVFRKAK